MHHHNKEAFEEICELVGDVEPDADGIRQSKSIEDVSKKFLDAIQDDKQLRWVGNEQHGGQEQDDDLESWTLWTSLNVNWTVQLPLFIGA